MFYNRKEHPVSTKQGDVGLLQDPVAQQLLQSIAPAHLAYTWTDGTPRVVPISFHWNGTEIVLGGPPDAPKMKALQEGTRVALSIDSDRMPYKVLLIRGTIHIDTVEGVSPEYAASCRRTLGEEAGNAWLGQMGALVPRMARIFIRPDWVAVQDFETRFPNAVEWAMERAAAP
jgi:pyridoxamine 5'-phosphate oxidase-like protein